MATSQAQGVNGQLCWVRETTWGTCPTTPSMVVIPFETESLDYSQARIQRSNLSTSRNPRRPTTGRAGCGGDITCLLNPLAHAYLLADQLGAPTTTGAGSPYTHTYKINAAPVGASIEKGFTDVPRYHLFTGLRGAGFSLKIGDSGPVEATFKYNGKTEAVSASPQDASPDALSDLPFDCGNGSMTVTEGGTAIAIVTSVELNVEIDQGTDAYVLGGGGTRGALPVGAVKVTGKLTALFDDTRAVSLYTKAKAGTESALVIVLAHGTGAGTAGNEKLTLTVPELVFDTNTPKISGPAGVQYEGPFTAYYDNNANATALMLELMNAQATVG